MKVALTGAIQVGKSTILKKVIAAAGAQIGGFFTVSRQRDDGYLDVFIIPADNLDAPCSETNRIGIRLLKGNYVASPEAFETVGCDILDAAVGKQLVVMDELGMMENLAPHFQAKVLQILNGGQDAIMVVKPRHTAFLDSVRAVPGLVIKEVTMENRDQVCREVLDLFTK